MLALPEATTIHPVFHVSQLRKAVGRTLPIFTLPRDLADDDIIRVQPVEVIGVRWIPTSLEVEVLIRWEEGSADEATWEANETNKSIS